MTDPKEEATKALIEYAKDLMETHDMTFDQVVERAEKNKRGGLRNPPGGRPPLPEGEKRVKVSITLDQATIDRLRGQAERENEPLSRIIERLLLNNSAA